MIKAERVAVAVAVAVVGAGIAGLRCARLLQDNGMHVTVFDKARGPSGRMSTRRAEGALQFDHGAQYFTARDPAFAAMVACWVEQGHAARWDGRFGRLFGGEYEPEQPKHPRFVGTPRMSALGRHLADGLTLRLGARVLELLRDDRWWLRDDHGVQHGPFHRVVLAIPAPQALALARGVPAVMSALVRVQMQPCYALMLRFERDLDLPWEGVSVEGGPLAWIAHDSSKPGRRTSNCFVAHTSPAAAHYLLERPVHEVTTRLVRAFQAAARIPDAPVHAVVHRWRFARPKPTGGAQRPLYDAGMGVGACGDWRTGPRVEAAWHSGQAMAEALLAAPAPRQLVTQISLPS